MLARILCATVGHVWNRRLRAGYPSKRCRRCDLEVWA
jgi:endogenous inhibitor of DNA gyrase (YacG/DUF329 family)